MFRVGQGCGSSLTDRSLAPLLCGAYSKGAKACGLPEIFSPHSFRVVVVTDLLKQKLVLEDVQYQSGHTYPRTMRIFDRRRRRASRNLVERVSVLRTLSTAGGPLGCPTHCWPDTTFNASRSAARNLSLA